MIVAFAAMIAAFVTDRARRDALRRRRLTASGRTAHLRQATMPSITATVSFGSRTRTVSSPSSFAG